MRLLASFLTTFLLHGIVSATAETVPAGIKSTLVQGTVYDTSNGQPIPFVTVQVISTGKSALVNQEGRYRLILSPGQYQLKFTHIGYYSTTIAASVGDTTAAYDVYLKPGILQIGAVTVYDQQYDPGQRIIIEAIKRKKDILDKIHDYRFDAYTKLVVRQLPKPDSAKIMLITETQLTCFWEQPDKYKEVITARKQSSNLPPEANMVGVGRILNFNRNRIDIERYSLVSPTAKDALDYYNYYLKDSVYVDNRKIYRLEIEPKNDANQLFVGNISIVDSTFDVVEVDVGVNKAVAVPFLSNLRYQQHFAQLDREYWMPIEIRFSADVHIKFPGVPPNMKFEHHASLYDYSFDRGNPKGTFSDYDFEVAENADKIDSTAWYSRQTIPLTTEETRGYQMIDSLEKAPVPFGKQVTRTGLTVVGGALYLALGGSHDIFHFNRVEGPYLGMQVELNRLRPGTVLTLKGGYGFNEKHGQYAIGIDQRLWRKHQLIVGAQYQQAIVNRPVQPGGWVSPTFDVLTAKRDPYDYYFQRGLTAHVSGRILRQTTLTATYNDYRQSSVGVNTQYSLLSQDSKHRPNPPIADGRLRSLSASLTFDSRKLSRIKDRDVVSPLVQYTLARVGVETSSPGFLKSDLDFHKYDLYLYRRQRTFDFGVTSFTLYGATSDRGLPPQRFYQIVSGAGAIAGNASFYTVYEQGFVGDRGLSLYIEHDFRQILFRKSHLPLIKNIPFTLSVHGGAFWTEFRNRGFADHYKTAPTPYSEIGFGIGNLTPFLSIFNFQIHFTWQLSHYASNAFTLSWGIGN